MSVSDDKAKTPGGMVVPMHSDAKIESKLSEAIRIIEDLRTCFTAGFSISVFEKLIEFLQAIRFIRDQNTISKLAEGLIDSFVELESFFADLPVDAPSSTNEMQSLARRLEVYWQQKQSDLQMSLKSTHTAYAQLKERHAELVNQDRKGLNRLESTIGGMASRLRTSLDAVREDIALRQQLEHANAEKAQLQARLDATRLSEHVTLAQRLQATLGKFDRSVRLLDLSTSEGSVGNLPAEDHLGLTEEIERRLDWFQECSQAQEEAETQREAIRDELAAIEESLKFKSDEDESGLRLREIELNTQLKAVSTLISQLVAGQTIERKAFEPLRRFHDAVQLIAQGLPEDMRCLQDHELQPIPECDLHHVVAPHPDPTPVLDSQQEASIRQHHGRLITIGTAHGLTLKEVLITTLYEVMPPRPGRGGGLYNKGLVTVCTAARDSGILRRFGWVSPRDLLLKWHGEVDESSEEFKEYLGYSGSMGTRKTYRRTKTPLPWSIADILTHKEIEVFEQHIRKTWKVKKQK